MRKCKLSFKAYATSIVHSNYVTPEILNTGSDTREVQTFEPVDQINETVEKVIIVELHKLTELVDLSTDLDCSELEALSELRGTKPGKAKSLTAKF